MNLLFDDMPSYRTGIGLLAIHSAISLSDAIKVGLTGKKAKYQDHARASLELERICSSAGVGDKRGLVHFKWLLAQKTAIAYSQDRLDDSSLRQAVDKAQKFNAWAYNCFREILRDTEAQA